jgi:HEPN domain-containing protein
VSTKSLIVNRKDFKRIAKLRIKEAKILLDNGYYSGAYYLAGYAVECALKARIAKDIKQHDFPDRKLANAVNIHKLEELLTYSGEKENLIEAIEADQILELNWTIVKDWKVTDRYRDNITQKDAHDLYLAVTQRVHGVLTWLKKCW